MLSLCVFHLVCTLPYGINHGFMHNMLPAEDDNVWNMLIAICWWSFGRNFVFYVTRNDPYRNANQFYLEEKMIHCLSNIRFTINNNLPESEKWTTSIMHYIEL